MTTATIEKEITVTVKALKDELGRRHNNKSREVKVRAKAWYLPMFSKAEIDQLVAGETLVKTFKSEKTYAFKVK